MVARSSGTPKAMNRRDPGERDSAYRDHPYRAAKLGWLPAMIILTLLVLLVVGLVLTT
jgi:hypothetical protein